MYNVIFEKIFNNHDELRNNIIHGKSEELPTIGRCFDFFGKPIDTNMNFRAVNTSPLVAVECSDDVYEVETMSGSKYKITITKV
jgi:hypothetical protein